MAIKIVTDSTADIPPQLAESLGITIVPLYVRFGEKALKDGVEITQDQFFEKLQTSTVHPNTSQPSPQDFIDVYQKLAQDCDGMSRYISLPNFPAHMTPLFKPKNCWAMMPHQ